MVTVDLSDIRTVLHIAIDIETSTIESTREGPLREKLFEKAEAPSNYKDPQKILEYKHGWVDGQIERSALNPNYGIISCIGAAWINPENPDDILYACFGAWDEFNGPEGCRPDAAAIWGFYNFLVEMEKKHVIQFVSKAGKRFDYPFIKVRAYANGCGELVKLLPNHRDYSQIDFENEEFWPGATRDSRVTLDTIAELLGIEQNPTVSGKEMPRLFTEGKFDLIREHNMEDCLVTLRVAKHLNLV
jgi:hypothetical protein